MKKPSIAQRFISPELEIGYDDFRTYLDHENTFTLPDTVAVNNNDDDEGTFTIDLTGNGAIAEIDLIPGDTDLPSGTTQDFGSVNVDTGEIQQTFTILGLMGFNHYRKTFF